MASETYETIISDAISGALGLPTDTIPVKLRNIALGFANEEAEAIWNTWRWRNELLDEVEVSPAATGIITFGSTVDQVLAVIKKSDNSENNTPIWNEDARLAWARGERLVSDKFRHLAADSSLNRRILVEEPESGDTPLYAALALKKYTKATVESTYDANDPTATPTDYRVLVWALDNALPALKAKVKDALRDFQGMKMRGNGDRLLKAAYMRENEDAAVNTRTEPRSPLYGEVGNWEDDY